MHEFIDGCSVQYKSQLCMIDVDTCISKLGYKVLMRNFYETSHGKGSHAAVGGIFFKTTWTSQSHTGSLKRH
jgi:hypothetical protein